jgi:hypothetical protein
MLDEEEYGQVMALWRQDGAMKERLALMFAEYVRITHYAETNPNAVWHHRLSLYGPPCRSCGKPLRTPQAKAVSMGGCNTGLKFTSGSLKAQSFSRALI